MITPFVGHFVRFPFSQNFRNFRFGGKWNTFFPENVENLGAFHLGKKAGNFGGSKSGISDW